MFKGIEFRNSVYYRKSKYGTMHSYLRKKTVLVLECDNCGTIFNRDKGNMDPNRVNDNVYHVCGNCDAKKFAQKKGVEMRKIWTVRVDSTKPIDQL